MRWVARETEGGGGGGGGGDDWQQPAKEKLLCPGSWEKPLAMGIAEKPLKNLPRARYKGARARRTFLILPLSFLLF